MPVGAGMLLKVGARPSPGDMWIFGFRNSTSVGYVWHRSKLGVWTQYQPTFDGFPTGFQSGCRHPDDPPGTIYGGYRSRAQGTWYLGETYSLNRPMAARSTDYGATWTSIRTTNRLVRYQASGSRYIQQNNASDSDFENEVASGCIFSPAPGTVVAIGSRFQDSGFTFVDAGGGFPYPLLYVQLGWMKSIGGADFTWQGSIADLDPGFFGGTLGWSARSMLGNFHAYNAGKFLLTPGISSPGGSTYDKLIVSNDAGATFSLENAPFATSVSSPQQVGYVNGGTALFAGRAGGNRKVYKSTTLSSWTDTYTLASTTTIGQIANNAASNFVYTPSALFPVFRTTDGGANWSSSALGFLIDRLTFVNGKFWAVAPLQQNAYSSPDGITWTAEKFHNFTPSDITIMAIVGD